MSRQDDVTLDQIADKIRKLLALSKSSNPNEAALAASRAQELLFKYKIDMSRVEKTAKGVVGLKEFHLAEKRGHRNQHWRLVLLDGVCKNNWCRVVVHGHGCDRYTTIIGRKEDIQVVEYLHVYLSRTIDELARQFYQDWKASHPGIGHHDYGFLDPFRSYLSFCNGATDTVTARLAEQRRQDEKAAGAESTALIRREDALVLQKMQETWPKLGKAKMNSNSRSHDAASAGREAGRNISLNKGVGTTGERKGLK